MNPKFLPLPHRGFWFAAGLSAATASIGLFGGIGLQAVESDLIRLTPLLVAVPALYASAGNYAMVISAHLSDPQLYRARFQALLKALLLAVPVSIAGVSAISLLVAQLQGYHLSLALAKHYIGFYAVSLILVVTITLISAFITNKVLRAKLINSDDMLLSIMDNVASVLMLISVALAAQFYF